jgi:hypothetical protein
LRATSALATAIGGMLCSCLLVSPLNHQDRSDAIEPPADGGAHDPSVPLTTPECPLVYGAAGDTNAIVLGAYATLGSTSLEDSGVLLDYQLALDELNQAGGLPDPPPGTKHHPLALVVCNNVPAGPSMGSSFLDKSLAHLVGELHVPAIVAYLLPDDLKYAFETFGRPHQVFFLSPIGATQSLDAEPDDDLLWHMLGQPSDLAPGYEALARLLQGYIEKTQAIDSVRVATVTTTAAFDSELARAVTSLFDGNLTFNGKTLVDNALDCGAGGCQYRAFTVDGAHPPDVVAAELVAFQPNIIVSLADDRFTQPQTGVLPIVESTWNPAATRPYYILSPINAGALPDVEAAFDGLLSLSTAPTHQRFMGIGVARAKDPTLYNEYIGRLLTAFRSAPVDTENFYDTVYFLADAVSAAIDDMGLGRPLSGPAIASGMQQLISGSIAYSIGPGDINNVLRALAQGPLRLDGTLGPPDFYPGGTRIDTASVYCFDSDGAPQIQVLRYDPTVAPPFAGSFDRCFSGFLP